MPAYVIIETAVSRIWRGRTRLVTVVFHTTEERDACAMVGRRVNESYAALDRLIAKLG